MAQAGPAAGGAAAGNFNAAQFVQAIHAMSDKAPTLSETTPRAFRIWRTQFELVAGARGWNALDAKRKAKCSLREDAAELALDVDINVAGQNLAAFLDALQARFIPAAATDIARSQFQTAAQLPTESVIVWAARVKNSFLTAYPGVRAQAFDTDPDLIRQFAMGLANETVGRNVLNQAPQTFQAACNFAQQYLATEALWARRGSIRSLGEEGVNAMNRNSRYSTSSIECWNCGRRGHVARDCPRGSYGGQRGRGRGTGRGGRGASSNRGRRGRGGARFSPYGRGGSSRGGAVRQLSAEQTADEEEENFAAELLDALELQDSAAGQACATTTSKAD